jgi:catechol 2,3-dioxygenase-like lactoylglutathione lyase family enzyme
LKTEGIDHVAIIVKDMDRAVEFLHNLFEMEFEEILWSKERFGMRINISRPDGQIELFSVIDPFKATKLPAPFNKIAEITKGGGEGLCNLFLRVKDAEGAASEAERKGVHVTQILEEKEFMTFLPHFKEVFFSDEDMPVKQISLIWRDKMFGRG